MEPNNEALYSYNIFFDFPQMFGSHDALKVCYGTCSGLWRSIKNLPLDLLVCNNILIGKSPDLVWDGEVLLGPTGDDDPFLFFCFRAISNWHSLYTVRAAGSG